ncbi:MAG: prephenate dehydrogenase [Bacteroidales bacterium]
MNITIIGLGLIGGSIALALRQSGFAQHFVGVESTPNHATQALELGLVDEVLPLEEALTHADMVIVAVPVNATCTLLPQVLNSVPPSTIVVDMGSTKLQICQAVQQHPKRGQYVATHPMAGTEYSGPSAADANLFTGKKTIICEQNLSAEFALQGVLAMYSALQMEVLLYATAEEHDRQVAYVSHLSHVSSFMLGLTVLEVEQNEQQILNLASTGFESTVRLAKSSPYTWQPIFEQNAPELSRALSKYIKNLQAFKACIDTQDSVGLIKLMQEANKISKILK